MKVEKIEEHEKGVLTLHLEDGKKRNVKCGDCVADYDETTQEFLKMALSPQELRETPAQLINDTPLAMGDEAPAPAAQPLSPLELAAAKGEIDG